jgi:murein DD-endopeptidase MepM/ murein hydrolase activator NlpD
LFALVAVVAVGVVGIIPATPAGASPNVPPFEITFPQEVSKTHFSSTFGAYRSGGRRHKGNDLMAPRMTEVYAVAAGTVIDVGTNRLSGRNVKIDHGSGWNSYYLHLNNDNPGTDDGDAPWTLTAAPGVEVGKVVEAGQLIGWSGDSGNAEWTSPHTHFEIRLNGRAVNPFSLLRDAYERDFAREQALRYHTSLPGSDLE